MSSEMDTLKTLRQFIDGRISELEQEEALNSSFSVSQLPKFSPNGGLKVFKFSIGTNEKFTYDPPGDWRYSGANRIRFESDNGPFRITAVPDPTGALGFYQGPWRAPLESKRDSAGKWVAEMQPYDPKLGPKVRQALVDEQGYIARYKYIIEAHRDGEPYRDDTHNGEYEC